MSNVPLPQPRMHQPKVNVDPNHGLWGFFPAKGQAFYKPSETEQHGRAWTVEELRSKGFNELHALWWVCCRERNMLATSRKDMIKARVGFGEREIKNRDAEVWKTMKGIRHTLSERYYAWQDAVMIAEQDPEINLQGGEGNVYNAAEYNDALMLEQMDEEFTAEEMEANAAREAAAEKAYAESIGKSFPESSSEPIPEQPPKTRL
jgi:large subunit ribosomal protein L47